MNDPTQTETIRKHLEHVGPITPLEALKLYGVMRLAPRVLELRRAGLDVRTEKAESNGKHVARYRLA